MHVEGQTSKFSCWRDPHPIKITCRKSAQANRSSPAGNYRSSMGSSRPLSICWEQPGFLHHTHALCLWEEQKKSTCYCSQRLLGSQVPVVRFLSREFSASIGPCNPNHSQPPVLIQVNKIVENPSMHQKITQRCLFLRIFPYLFPHLSIMAQGR